MHSPKPPFGPGPGRHPGLTQFLPRGSGRRKEEGGVQTGTAASAPQPPSQGQTAQKAVLSSLSPRGSRQGNWPRATTPSPPHSSCETPTPTCMAPPPEGPTAGLPSNAPTAHASTHLPPHSQLFLWAMMVPNLAFGSQPQKCPLLQAALCTLPEPGAYSRTPPGPPSLHYTPLGFLVHLLAGWATRELRQQELRLCVHHCACAWHGPRPKQG